MVCFSYNGSDGMAGREWEIPTSVCWLKINNLPKKKKINK